MLEHVLKYCWYFTYLFPWVIRCWIQRYQTFKGFCESLYVFSSQVGGKDKTTFATSHLCFSREMWPSATEIWSGPKQQVWQPTLPHRYLHNFPSFGVWCPEQPNWTWQVHVTSGFTSCDKASGQQRDLTWQQNSRESNAGAGKREWKHNENTWQAWQGMQTQCVEGAKWPSTHGYAKSDAPLPKCNQLWFKLKGKGELNTEFSGVKRPQVKWGYMHVTTSTV